MPKSEGRRKHVASRRHQDKICRCWGRPGNITRLGATQTEDTKDKIGRSNRMPLEELLSRPNTSNTRMALKRRLIGDGVLANVCLICGIKPSWCGKPLTLQLDHINGDGTNHSPENLRLLCPNCHSQTSTFGGRNK